MKVTAAVIVLGALSLGGQDPPEFRALVFSKTAGFRHASIPNGLAAIRKLGAENNFAVDATEDSAQFTDESLSKYKTVIFLNTTGDILDAEQKAAFERFIRNGGGFTGVHSASDTEYNWPWYGELVGAYFRSHPRVQQATVHVNDDSHPSTAPLPKAWERTDEWYNFRSNPREFVHVLAVLDEGTYEGGSMGEDHPVSWCHEFDGGRAWYTAMGHTEESYTEALFLAHLLGGIRASAGVVPADCRVRPENRIPERRPRSRLDGPEEGHDTMRAGQ